MTIKVSIGFFPEFRKGELSTTGWVLFVLSLCVPWMSMAGWRRGKPGDETPLFLEMHFKDGLNQLSERFTFESDDRTRWR